MDQGNENNLQETGIVILHYEKEDLTRACIQSIKDNTPINSYHIYVVDNNSPTPIKMNTMEDPKVSVIKNYSRCSVSGMNRGFHYALYESKLPHKYIVNIDNDVIVHKDWLEPLVKEMELNPSTGICGGKQWKPDKSRYNSVGADLAGWIYNNFPINRMLVNWIQGSFHMYRVSMMHEIGLHDTRFRDICSDSDYCLHARDRGWDVVFVPESNVTHIGGASYKDFPVDHSLDFEHLISKWFGLKFNLLANTFPIDSERRLFGSVTYKEFRRL